MILPKELDNRIKDVIVSPKGGILLIYFNNIKEYKPSEEYIKKCSHCKEIKDKLNYSLIRTKKIRDNKILFKYILPEMFRKLKLVMPKFDSLNLKF